jgi:hypothetical protein
MAIFSATALAIAGLAVGAVGVGISYYSATQQASAQEDAIAAQQRAEALRKKQMNLDAMRRKREIVRASIAARSRALATTTAQGAGGGSALGGAYGGISGRTQTNLLGINQNQEIGLGMFDANMDMLSAYRSSAQAGAFGAMGAGLSTLGGALLKNNESIARVGTTAMGFFGRVTA